LETGTPRELHRGRWGTERPWWNRCPTDVAPMNAVGVAAVATSSIVDHRPARVSKASSPHQGVCELPGSSSNFLSGEPLENRGISAAFLLAENPETERSRGFSVSASLRGGCAGLAARARFSGSIEIDWGPLGNVMVPTEAQSESRRLSKSPFSTALAVNAAVPTLGPIEHELLLPTQVAHCSLRTSNSVPGWGSSEPPRTANPGAVECGT
jgi:hypothetical protein